MLKKQNLFMLGAFAFSLLTTILVIYTPGLNTAFEFAPIHADEFFIAMALGVTVIPFVELSKVITRFAVKKRAEKKLAK